MYFYLDWSDPGAYATVVNNTVRWKAGEIDCKRECSDYVGDQSCCDGIFMPALTFRFVIYAWCFCWVRCCWSCCNGISMPALTSGGLLSY